MSRRTSTLAHALAVCLMVAGMAPVTRAQPLSSGKPQASPLIISHRGQPGVPGREVPQVGERPHQEEVHPVVLPLSVYGLLSRSIRGQSRFPAHRGPSRFQAHVVPFDLRARIVVGARRDVRRWHLTAEPDVSCLSWQLLGAQWSDRARVKPAMTRFGSRVRISFERRTRGRRIEHVDDRR